MCYLVRVKILGFKICFLKLTEISIEWNLAVKLNDGHVPSQ
jgi:hypothetical protein